MSPRPLGPARSAPEPGCPPWYGCVVTVSGGSRGTEVSWIGGLEEQRWVLGWGSQQLFLKAGRFWRGPWRVCSLRLKAWVVVQVLQLAPSVTVGKSLLSLGLSFSIYAMGDLVCTPSAPSFPDPKKAWGRG